MQLAAAYENNFWLGHAAMLVNEGLPAFLVKHIKAKHDLSSSRVTLRRLAAAEIERYVQTGEPLDKAGGSAIQGRAAAFISRIEGSYSGIVGLPLHETASLLARVGVHVL
jgi:predicted house-cleaning NTP pyrophosphatase (Maf/HAM1 superfamily)